MIMSSNPSEAIAEIHSFAIKSVGYCKQLRLKAAKPKTKVPNELGKEINGICPWDDNAYVWVCKWHIGLY